MAVLIDSWNRAGKYQKCEFPKPLFIEVGEENESNAVLMDYSQ